MPLYDLERGCKPVNPKNARAFDVLQAADRKCGSVRFNHDAELVEAAIQLVKDTAASNPNNKFVFTRAGFMLGHRSGSPHRDVNHVWESAEIAFPIRGLNPGSINWAIGNRLQLQFVGGMVRWRIALQPETWLTSKTASLTPDGHQVHDFEGNEIHISQYFINENFIYTSSPSKKIKATPAQLGQLQARWNSMHA